QDAGRAEHADRIRDLGDGDAAREQDGAHDPTASQLTRYGAKMLFQFVSGSVSAVASASGTTSTMCTPFRAKLADRRPVSGTSTASSMAQTPSASRPVA